MGVWLISCVPHAQTSGRNMQTGRWQGSDPTAASGVECLHVRKPQWAGVTLRSFSFAVRKWLVVISSIRPSALSQGQRAFCILGSCPRVLGKSHMSLENERKVLLNGGSSSQLMDVEPEWEWSGKVVFPWSPLLSCGALLPWPLAEFPLASALLCHR
ncbi:uncharacterized protein [Macaca nemestrina]|uniref:uncharacterized protein n=1 Tax=Macaca nemestrina TaxID=9545 RepID=UPI0039B9D05B